MHSFFEAIERQSGEAGDCPELLSKDDIRLIRAFAGIGDPDVRRSIMGLILAVTEEADGAPFFGAAGLVARAAQAN